jgi:predicted CopG family antitoxin
MKKQILNEEITRMQKLAGLLTENEYEQKTKLLNEGNIFSDLIKNIFTSKTKKAEMAKAAAEAAAEAARLSKSSEEINKINSLANNNEFKTLLNNFATQYSKEWNKFEDETQSVTGDRMNAQYFMLDFDKKADALVQPLKDFLKKNNIDPELIVNFKTEMFKNLKNNKLAEIAPPTGEKPKTSDVNNLKKLLSANTSLLNRLQTVNNNNEVIEFLTYILNTINPKITGVNRATLKKIIDDRFTQ